RSHFGNVSNNTDVARQTLRRRPDYKARRGFGAVGEMDDRSCIGASSTPPRPPEVWVPAQQHPTEFLFPTKPPEIWDSMHSSFAVLLRRTERFPTVPFRIAWDFKGQRPLHERHSRPIAGPPFVRFTRRPMS